MDSAASEVLFGGAAGGGKSYAQVIDALIYALTYKGSKQLILRRTLPELNKSIIRTHLEIYPKSLYKYSASNHSGKFFNGSIIDFGYCDSENDVYKYQSAEYDVIRFDELTHFTRQMYIYLLSRVRGANSYPKQVKSSANPGGVGHTWVKERFIDIGPPGKVYKGEHGDRVFIPSLVTDNSFLLKADPNYIKRLQNLDEKDRKALLYGDWDIFEGQFFNEFDRKIHVTEPFEIPKHWRRYRAIDYGLDMLACYFIALSPLGEAYVYREVYESGLIVSEAAKAVKEQKGESIYATFAPPDLWNRHKDTGRSTAEIFLQYGVPFTKVSNARVQGWLDLKEWLKVYKDGQGEKTSDLKIFSSCINLIRTLPAIAYDSKNPSDTADTPHELTHAPDALRYFASGRPNPQKPKAREPKINFKCELKPKNERKII